MSPLLACRVALTMSVGWGKADLALGRIGAILFAPLVDPFAGSPPTPKRPPARSLRSPTPWRLCRTAGFPLRRSTRHSCFGSAQRRPNQCWPQAGDRARIARAARERHVCEVFTRRRVPICSLDSLQAPDYLAIKGLTRTAREANAERIRA